MFFSTAAPWHTTLPGHSCPWLVSPRRGSYHLPLDPPWPLRAALTRQCQRNLDEPTGRWTCPRLHRGSGTAAQCAGRGPALALLPGEPHQQPRPARRTTLHTMPACAKERGAMLPPESTQGSRGQPGLWPSSFNLRLSFTSRTPTHSGVHAGAADAGAACQGPSPALLLASTGCVGWTAMCTARERESGPGTEDLSYSLSLQWSRQTGPSSEGEEAEVRGCVVRHV